MPKTGLKTFIFSFSVSLFAIFAANGVYLHSRKATPQSLKISDKNITLFLKSEPASPSNLAVPVKKIALNVLPDIAPEHHADDDDIIMADLELEDIDLPEIPLEANPPSTQPLSPEPLAPVVLAQADKPKPQPEAKVIVEAKVDDHVIIPLQAPDIADTKAIRVARAAKPEPMPAPKAEPEEPKIAESLPQPIVLAEAEPIAAAPVLPIERGGDELLVNTTKVKIGSPNDLNQVALADKNIPIGSMTKEPAISAQADTAPATREWKSMDEAQAADSPWVVAKADGALKNSKLAEEDFYKKEGTEIKNALNPQKRSKNGVKVAAETVKNLLIPIPEDILNDENLTPQLSYSPKDKTEDVGKSVEKAAKEETKKSAATEEETKKNKLLSSLNSIFNSAPKDKAEKERINTAPNILSEIRKKLKTTSMGKIMPTEMRLSFQPNRAEISGQTLRWIQAFAARAADDQNMTIEIRIDGTTAMDLQQKRLNLLHNILTDKGVEYSKINTVFTQREPNSFIIKTITHNPSKQKRSNGNTNNSTAGYYQQW